MAEGWVRHLKSEKIDVFSAGVDPGTLDPRAVAVMKEVGVDISRHSPKSILDLIDKPLDIVVTVCDGAHESCPVFQGQTRVVHRGFEDPPRLAATAASEEEALNYYRRVRDEIRAYVETLPGALTPMQGAGAGGGEESAS
jgi:arsenate reductase